MALVPMTKEEFLQRWKEDAEKREKEKKDKAKRERQVVQNYIAEIVNKSQHKYHRRVPTSRFGA